jgi:hypothetical protein
MNCFKCNLRYLKPQSLLHLVNALVKLSQESMDIAYNNREPSLVSLISYPYILLKDSLIFYYYLIYTYLLCLKKLKNYNSIFSNKVRGREIIGNRNCKLISY